MKRTLHFATKLNSRDMQKYNCFWVPSYDLFASTRKAVFPAPTATGVHRLRNTWSSLWEVIFLQKSSTVLSEPKFPPPPHPTHPNQNSWMRIRPRIGYKRDYSLPFCQLILKMQTTCSHNSARSDFFLFLRCFVHLHSWIWCGLYKHYKVFWGVFVMRIKKYPFRRSWSIEQCQLLY